MLTIKTVSHVRHISYCYAWQANLKREVVFCFAKNVFKHNFKLCISLNFDPYQISRFLVSISLIDINNKGAAITLYY